MNTWEFHPRGQSSLERWSWRALNRDGSLHTRSRQEFDSFTKAFENAKSHGFDYKEHDWHVATLLEDA